eukprot:COSAG02_NODE_39821_length_412_cov_1.137380_1_plen_45_part_10
MRAVCSRLYTVRGVRESEGGWLINELAQSTEQLIHRCDADRESLP